MSRMDEETPLDLHRPPHVDQYRIAVLNGHRFTEDPETDLRVELWMLARLLP